MDSTILHEIVLRHFAREGNLSFCSPYLVNGQHVSAKEVLSVPEKTTITATSSIQHNDPALKGVSVELLERVWYIVRLFLTKCVRHTPIIAE